MFKLISVLFLLIPFLWPSQAEAIDCNNYSANITISDESPAIGSRVNFNAMPGSNVSTERIVSVNKDPSGISFTDGCVSLGGQLGWSCSIKSAGSGNYQVSWTVESFTTRETKVCAASKPFVVKRPQPNPDPASDNTTGQQGNSTKSNAPEDEPPGLPQLQTLFGRIIQVTGVGIFFALTVMLVVGGIKFLTSGGEAKPIQSAQLTITWAVLGILFLVLAWLFLLLIGSFTGIDLTQFSLRFDQ